MAATHSIYQVEDNAHGDAELLEVQIAIIIDVGHIPHALQLVVSQAAVL